MIVLKAYFNFFNLINPLKSWFMNLLTVYINWEGEILKQKNVTKSFIKN